jgi:hypothetical protein
MEKKSAGRWEHTTVKIVILITLLLSPISYSIVTSDKVGTRQF